MSAAFNSASRAHSNRSRASLRVLPDQGQAAQVQSASFRPSLAVVPETAVVRPLPLRSFPSWLRLLLNLQRGSVMIVFILAALALSLYGSTVQTQQHLSEQYRKLRTLQRNERHMLVTGETIKYQLAQQAERPESGLSLQTPKDAIMVQSAPQRPVPTPTPSIAPSAPASANPLGY